MNFKIDQLATEYERNWNSANRSFESYLRHVSKDEQNELIKLLIEIDIERVRLTGTPARAADYEDYGPEYFSYANDFIESSERPADPPSSDAPERSSNLKSSREMATLEGNGAHEQEHPERIGSYRILNLLAVHGQGTVYRADHPHLNRQVVIKVSKNQLDKINQRAVLEEGRALAALSHSNLAQVYDLQFHDNCPYLVMEYIEGRNLAERMKDTLLPPREAADLIATLADAIQHAHNVGIVHQDLKPANIVIRAVDNTPKIIDFGLASTRTAYDADDSLNTSYGGTIAYMAPEQAQQLLSSQATKAADERVDIFALGAILYQLVTGQNLYSFDNLTDGLEQAAKCDFDASLLDDIPTDLKEVCLKALAREPARRWRSASDLAVALRRSTPKSQFPSVLMATTFGGLVIGFAVWILINQSSQASVENKTASSMAGERPAADSDGPEIIVPTSLLEPPPGASFTHYISRDNKGKLFTKGLVHEGHQLRIELDFSEPTFCFLFAINPDGAVQLCYPHPSFEPYEESLDEVQAEPILHLNYPLDPEAGFNFIDGAGQQTFILVQSEKPLPKFREWSESAGHLAGAVKSRGYWMFTDGTIRPEPGKTRGAPTKIGGFASFATVMESIQNSNPECNVFGLSFPVEPR